MTSKQEKAQVIRQQITKNTLWACGAREFYFEDGKDKFDVSLTFGVTIKPRTTHKVRVTLHYDDTYTVELFKITRSLDVVTQFKLDDVHADMLAGLIYDITLDPDLNTHVWID